MTTRAQADWLDGLERDIASEEQRARSEIGQAGELLLGTLTHGDSQTVVGDLQRLGKLQERLAELLLRAAVVASLRATCPATRREPDAEKGLLGLQWDDRREAWSTRTRGRP